MRRPVLAADHHVPHALLQLADWRGRGCFARARPRAGRGLQWLACVYALSMVVRYAVTLSHPIPIVFHWVLAAYLFTLGGDMRYRRRATTSLTHPRVA